MKKNLTGLELKYVVEELQELVGSKVAKIFQPLKKEIYIQFYGSKTGKRLLRIAAPSFMYLTEYRKESPERPKGFLQSLRKWLNQARLRGIKQDGLERVVEFKFEAKDGDYNLVVELFSKGNVILCRDDYTIVSSMEAQQWRDREIKSRVKYNFPQAGVDVTKLTIEEFSGMLKDTKKDSVVKFLAIELGLGGLYAEELCALSGVDKSSLGLKESEVKSLHKNLAGLVSKKAEPVHLIVEGEVAHVLPFKLMSVMGDFKKFRHYNEALDEALTGEILEERWQDTPEDMERARIERIIRMQTEKIAEMEKEAAEAQRKGELIYEKYQEVKALLDGLNADLKRLPKEELKKKYKLEELDLKNKTVTISL
jgi:predicted ribosome quality control (RQC) complex YloA/Tae2 family protein